MHGLDWTGLIQTALVLVDFVWFDTFEGWVVRVVVWLDCAGKALVGRAGLCLTGLVD